MTTSSTREMVIAALTQVAPEVDPNSLNDAVPLRDQVDIDSMDFLNLVIALSELTGVQIPEADYPQLQSVDDFVGYLE